jgi:hypothetical protein
MPQLSLSPLCNGEEKNIHSFEHCQQAGQRIDKETSNSMEICSKIHMGAQEMIKGCRLPQLEELGHNLVMEELGDKVQ